MNENERIDTTNKNHKVRWRTQDENMRWITTETKCGPNFQYKNFSVILNFVFLPFLQILNVTVCTDFLVF